MMVFAQNTRCSGRGFAFTPLAKLDDGMFDLVVVKKCGVLKTVRLFDAVKNGAGHVQDGSVCYVKVKKATLAAKDSTDLVGIDGEVDVTTPIKLEVVEGAFKTFV
jgi:diacylglycerol kinase family enzyme